MTLTMTMTLLLRQLKVVLYPNNLFKSIEKKSSALMPPSPTINDDFGLNICLNFSNPSVRFSALLFTSIATRELFFCRIKSTSSLRNLPSTCYDLDKLSILFQSWFNHVIFSSFIHSVTFYAVKWLFLRSANIRNILNEDNDNKEPPPLINQRRRLMSKYHRKTHQLLIV